MINLRMSSFTYGAITIQPMVPAEHSSLLIQGSKTGYAEGDYGKIILQEVHIKNLTILYNVFQVKEDLALDFRCHPGNMQIHAALRNDAHYYIQGMGDLYLTEGQFNVLDAQDIEGTCFLEHGNEYRTFHAIYSPDALDSMLPLFPPMEEWLSSDATTQPRLLFKSHPLLTAPLKDIIEKVIHCNYTDDLRRIYLEMKMREFLFLSVIPLGQEVTPSIKLSRRNIEIIHESKHILERHFDQHITITGVSKQVGMNEFKLKAGFKKLFGISMFDYLVQTKMLAARNLLLETDKPIKEIAHLTGYATKQSFLNAFKKYFHDTPGSLRKS